MLGNESRTHTFPSGGTLLRRYRRVKRDGSGNMVYAGAANEDIAILTRSAMVTDEGASSFMLGDVVKVVAAGAIAVDATIYPAADGKVSTNVAGSAWGTALTAAAADGEIIEAFRPFGGTVVGGDGSGDVTKVATPVDNQVGVWTGDGTIEGDAAFTFDTTDNSIVIGASGKFKFGEVEILSDSSGTTTLKNIDAIDTATKNTINNEIPAAGAATAGLVELATSAETTWGTDATRAVTPDGLSQSIHGQESVAIISHESDDDVAVADGKVAFTVPAQLNGMDLVDVACSVHTKGVTGTTTVVVRRKRGASEDDMTSTGVTIGDEYYANDEVIDGTKDDVNTGDQIYIDVNGIHSGTAPKGLSTTLTFKTPD